MEGISIHGGGDPDCLVHVETLRSRSAPRETLVRVAPAAILVTELKWEETYQPPMGEPGPPPIPGRDLSGIATKVGVGLVDGDRAGARILERRAT